MKILDIVKCTGKHPWGDQFFVVLNRMPIFKYKRTGNLFTAIDGICCDALAYERGSRGAFGGQVFNIDLEDGGKFKCAGNVWAVAKQKATDKPILEWGVATEDMLRKCFVFCGGGVFTESINEWLKDNEIKTDYFEYRDRLAKERDNE